MFLYFDCKDKKKNNTLQIFLQVFCNYYNKIVEIEG